MNEIRYRQIISNFYWKIYLLQKLGKVFFVIQLIYDKYFSANDYLNMAEWNIYPRISKSCKLFIWTFTQGSWNHVVNATGFDSSVCADSRHRDGCDNCDLVIEFFFNLIVRTMQLITYFGRWSLFKLTQTNQDYKIIKSKTTDIVEIFKL